MRDSIDFLLYDWLRLESLLDRPRFSDHSKATFAEVLDTCERIAREKVAPFNRLSDVDEPRLEDGRVILPRESVAAAHAYVASGMLAASQDYEFGGMQLPSVVESAGNAFYYKAGGAVGGGSLLTTGNANLLRVHGTPTQQGVFARNEFSGRWFGTMCLSEPQAGSGLADIITRAEPDGSGYERDALGPRYRLRGNKMWVSNGDHEVSENIVHLVLAKIPGDDGRLAPGTRGISLFIVPKLIVDESGSLTGERNDVVVAGLNHKLGNRAVPNALLNFGEGHFKVRGSPGAIGYRVGLPGEGLKCMFHMMNEARIAIGLSAAAIGYAGYEASVEYARGRRQGRRVGRQGKDPSLPPVPIIEHTDVKRMLLAQKAYVVGGLALELYCARLVDEVRTGAAASAEQASELLEILTPIAKSWPSEWCLEANSLAIQVHGGYGYTRDFPVEQYWRDNRLNMIHEGTHGIQALDLLGRKATMNGGAALRLLTSRVTDTIARVERAQFVGSAQRLARAVADVGATTTAAWATGDPEDALANAVPYMQAVGHVIVAWLWLDVANAAQRLLDDAPHSPRTDLLRGLQQAARYFLEFELPKIDAWLKVVATRNGVCREMRNEWF